MVPAQKTPAMPAQLVPGFEVAPGKLFDPVTGRDQDGFHEAPGAASSPLTHPVIAYREEQLFRAVSTGTSSKVNPPQMTCEPFIV